VTKLRLCQPFFGFKPTFLAGLRLARLEAPPAEFSPVLSTMSALYPKLCLSQRVYIRLPAAQVDRAIPCAMGKINASATSLF
jgi:hypothetical protein